MFYARSIFEPVTKFVACAAFLACSLFGKPLHDLHHVLEDSTLNESAAGFCCHSHTHCDSDSSHRHGSDQHASTQPEHSDGHRHSDQSPGHSHDSHNCAVCYTLCISATSPQSVAVSVDQDAASWQLVVLSETFAETCYHSDEARGPPFLV